AALEALDARDPTRALELASLVDMRGGKKDAWPDGSMPEVKVATSAARDAIKRECEKGPLSLRWGPADEELARVLPHMRTAYEHASRHMEQARRETRVLGFADLELHALRALAHAHVRQHYADRWK